MILLKILVDGNNEPGFVDPCCESVPGFEAAPAATGASMGRRIPRQDLKRCNDFPQVVQLLKPKYSRHWKADRVGLTFQVPSHGCMLSGEDLPGLLQKSQRCGLPAAWSTHGSPMAGWAFFLNSFLNLPWLDFFLNCSRIGQIPQYDFY